MCDSFFVNTAVNDFLCLVRDDRLIDSFQVPWDGLICYEIMRKVKQLFGYLLNFYCAGDMALSRS